MSSVNMATVMKSKKTALLHTFSDGARLFGYPENAHRNLAGCFVIVEDENNWETFKNLDSVLSAALIREWKNGMHR